MVRLALTLLLLSGGAASAVTLTGQGAESDWDAISHCGQSFCGEVYRMEERGFVYYNEANYGFSKMIGIETEQGGSGSLLYRDGHRTFALSRARLQKSSGPLFFNGPYWDNRFDDDGNPIDAEPMDLRFAIFGYLDGVEVARKIIDADISGGLAWDDEWQEYYPLGAEVDVAGRAWRKLDLVAFELLYPRRYVVNPFGGETEPGDAVCYDDWCGTVYVTALEVAPVPLPGAGLLLAGGFGTLAIARRAGRQRSGADAVAG